ncbi:colorectal mutant cancer protein isoform X2 [Rhinichthys klamathensis goyatoka]|uniref:colorectal mutant cancer protein isoform X2 n=1 Tax=Rhinichthys klamathensis goyatoka TaxID=3034132 RepID=UPI0024B5A696|nr:colorectal mutant cancer protein isoform X2 [Rhinichthys klamathensis goyatoka]
MTQQRSDSLESADSELAQCETEVSTLLQIISELNRKMDSLQIPREMKPPEGHVCVSGGVPQQGLRSPAYSLTAADAGTASVETKTKNISEGGSSDLWNELQKVLSALEISSGHGRKMLRLQTQNSERVQAHHVSAGRESWVKATQVLEEMESDLGISYPSALPPDERRQYQRDVLTLYKHNQDLNTSLKSHQEELLGAESLLIGLEDEKKWLMEKLVDLKRKWLYGVSRSPPVSPSLSSSRTSSPCFSSPPYPGSPLLSRKLPGSRPDSPSSPFTVDSVLQAEIEKLQRCLERLKARNERLNGALVRRKGESEQLSMSLSRQEADSSALHMALAYCEECEEAYSDLLSLCEARRQQNAEQMSTPQSDLSKLTDVNSDKGEPSSSPLEGTAENRTNSLSGQEFEGQAGVILQRIARLKQDRAAMCIPQQRGKAGEGKISPDTGTLAGVRGRTSSLSKNTKEEKAVLLYELVTVREEMSEMRGNLRLLEKERRCLDLALMVQSAQDSAGALILDSLRDELGERRATQQRIAENLANIEVEGEIPGPRNHSILRELQAALQREQSLKKRVAALRESLDSAVTDSTTQRRVNREENARLSRYYNKVSSTYRSSRKKHQEQLWRLEKQIAVMNERHTAKEAELSATLEAIKWRREETIL